MHPLACLKHGALLGITVIFKSRLPAPGSLWLVQACKNLGRYDDVFSDHTDLRPTIVPLVGLKDDYVHDGRALIEILEPHALPHDLRKDPDGFIRLAQFYKQINAPLGLVGKSSLVFADRAIKSNDQGYPNYLSAMNFITETRTRVAGEIIALLNAAEFEKQPIPEDQSEHLVDRANKLIKEVQELADEATESR